MTRSSTHAGASRYADPGRCLSRPSNGAASARRRSMVAHNVSALLAILCVGCSDDPSPVDVSDAGPVDMTGATDGGVELEDAREAPDTNGETDTGAPPEDVGDPSMDGGADAAAPVDMGAPLPCDYETRSDVLVIEAEDLPVVEDWVIATNEAGYTGDGYIEWIGASHNNDPSHGVMSVAIRIDTPGRYQMQWHVRIGQGTNTTEHNDAFVRFADASDFYGLQIQSGAEIRRYPRPQCEDPAFTDAKEALPEVDVADCVRSSSSDGWIKVYSSGASDWRWSTKTSDNDASDIMIEFDDAGVYTFELAARADHFLIDRIVLHLESVANDVARDLDSPPTPCEL